jgi:uncharacterized protein with HEPN domain
MRDAEKDVVRLRHMLNACEILVNNRGRDTLEEVKNNPVKFYGYVKLVEIIGEAAYNLTKEYRVAHPETPWKMIEGMRHVLVHDYYRISPEKLWDTILSDIPQLHEQLCRLLSSGE